ncbi:hypothetical protein AB0H37_38320 [Actinomadura sp. NPDC023710]|uniref:endonuclease/exonuclease/phosphatase family protein n=1 Tax=Actinomadura sp. NPDC023710 TaxID=3158219 RepID=UPI0033D7DC3A
MRPDSFTLRVATYNLNGAGPDGEDDSRLTQQISLLKTLKVDLLGLQGATWGEHRKQRVQDVARELGMTSWNIAPSPFYGHNIVVLVRENDRLSVTRKRSLFGPPWVHAHADIELEVPCHPSRLHFMVGHAPSASPTMRLAEAEMMNAFRHLPVIYAAAFSAPALGDDPDTTGVDAATVARHLDYRPAKELDAAGLVDIGAAHDDRPTVGHHALDPLSYRSDRIHTNLPPGWVTRYEVVQEAQPLSNNRPVCADITIGGRPRVFS